MLQVLLGAAAVLLHAFAIVSLLLAERRQPSATLAWLLALIFLPVVGVVLYLLIGRTRARRRARKTAATRLRLTRVLEKHNLRDRLARQRDGADMDPRTRSLLRLGRTLASTPASPGNSVQTLTDGAATYREMLVAADAAQDHIHVDFYIIQPDETGHAMREVLAAKAKEGVQVRILTDGIGSVGLPADFWEPVEQAGGKAAVFSPVSRAFTRLRRPYRVDFRNHRKIVVVDGQVGFTGGINVGREYLGLDPDRGNWRDTHMRIEGPAVLSLQYSFSEDWLFASGELLEDARYFPSPPSEGAGDCVVQVIDSGPDRKWSAIEHVYVQALALAKERAWIANPYFVPSAPVEQALVAAALRGVDVRLLLPAHVDSFLVRWAARSYYPQLLRAGVRVYLYERGFLHAKTMVVDEWVSTIGSANMDMRSFNLNYELNAFVYGPEISRDLAAQFEMDLRDAREVTQEEVRSWGLRARIVTALARLAAPLL